MKYLFLSYALDDIEAVRELANKLELAGYIPWIDPAEERDKSQLSSQTVFAIERSDGFFFVLTPNAVDSERVLHELVVAQKAQKPIAIITLSPATLPSGLNAYLSGSPAVDLSADFEDGFNRLLNSLEGGDSPDWEADLLVDTSGGEGLVEIPRLPSEEVIWSEAGYYWYKNWRNLTRVKALATTNRLIFIWDNRDTWKWKAREAKELAAAFPITILHTDIDSIGQVQRPRILFVLSNSEPYVEAVSKKGVVHKFTLHRRFEQLVDSWRELVAQSDRHDDGPADSN